MLGLSTICFRTFFTYRSDIDEGMLLSSAMRVAQGQVMYRDFFEFWMPGGVYLTAFFLKIFGLHYAVAKILFIVLNLSTYVSVYLTLRKAGFTLGSAVLSASITAFCWYGLLALNNHAFALFGLTICIYLLLSYNETKSRHLIVLLGLATSLTILFSQYEGIVAFTLACFCLYQISLPTTRLKNLGPLFLSTILPLLGLVLAAAIAGFLPKLLYDTITFPLAQYNRVNGFGPNIIVASQAILVILSYLYLRHQKILTAKLQILFGVSALLLLVNQTGSSVFLPLFTGIFSHALIVFVCWQFFRRWLQSRQEPYMQYIRASLGRGLLLPTWEFGRGFLFVPIVLMYAAILLLYLGGNWYGLLASPHQAIITPAGRVDVPTKQAGRFMMIRDFIQNHIASDQPLYIGPYSSYYYFLLHRSNPTKYSQLTPKYNPPWMINDAIKSLAQTKPAYLVILPDESAFAFGQDNILSNYIAQHYQILKKLPPIPIPVERQRLKSQDPPPAIWQKDTTATQ